MATVPLTAPYALKNAMLEISTTLDPESAIFDDHTAPVSSVNFTQNTPTASWVGIGGNTLTDIGSPTWQLALAYLQDLAAGGLHRYMLDHHGETRLLRLTPITADGEPGADVAIIATVRLAAGNIGGAAGPAPASATSTLAVIGKPAFVDPTP